MVGCDEFYIRSTDGDMLKFTMSLILADCVHVTLIPTAGKKQFARFRFADLAALLFSSPKSEFDNAVDNVTRSLQMLDEIEEASAIKRQSVIDRMEELAAVPQKTVTPSIPKFITMYTTPKEQ